MGDTGLSRVGNGISDGPGGAMDPCKWHTPNGRRSLCQHRRLRSRPQSGGGIEVSTTPLTELGALHDDVYVGTARQREPRASVPTS